MMIAKLQQLSLQHYLENKFFNNIYNKSTTWNKSEKNKNLYIEKYKSEHSYYGGVTLGDVDYKGGIHREQRTHYEWIFKKQSIELLEWIDIFDTGNRKYKGLKIVYKQDALYEAWREEEELKKYERKFN